MRVDFSVIRPAVECVLTFFIIGCAGFVMAGRDWFGKEARRGMSRLLTLVAMPLYLVHNINSAMSKDSLLQLAHGLLPSYLSITAVLCLGAVLARAARVRPSRRGLFCCGAAFSNTMYMGLPVNLALFGREAAPFVLLYYFSNTSLFWSVGNHLLAADGRRTGRPPSVRETVRNILSPPLLGFLAGLALLALDLRLPAFAANAARHLGDLTTPLAIIAIGVTLRELGLSGIRFDRDLLLVLAGRFVASPLAMLAATWLFPLPDLMRKVFIIQASLPLMSTTGIVAAHHGADEEFATVAVSSSTLLSAFTIPLFMLLASSLT